MPDKPTKQVFDMGNENDFHVKSGQLRMILNKSNPKKDQESDDGNVSDEQPVSANQVFAKSMVLD